jgi:hypothetical protein
MTFIEIWGWIEKEQDDNGPEFQAASGLTHRLTDHHTSHEALPPTEKIILKTFF